MAVTVTATPVSTFAAGGDAARPGGTQSGAVQVPITGTGTVPMNMGWNNPVGDPSWVPDFDWYHRYQLEAVAGAGEDVRIVNWECYDNSVLKVASAADLTSATAGTTVSPYGPLIINDATWTFWSTTGSSTAAAAKYAETGRSALGSSQLRATGQRVQVVLGPRKRVAGSSSTVWTIVAHLPGTVSAGAAGVSGHVQSSSTRTFTLPTAKASVTVAPPLPAQLPSASPFASTASLIERSVKARSTVGDGGEDPEPEAVTPAKKGKK